MTDITDRLEELRAARHSFWNALRTISAETGIDVASLERVVKRAQKDDEQDARTRARGAVPGWQKWIERENLEPWPPRRPTAAATSPTPEAVAVVHKPERPERPSRPPYKRTKRGSRGGVNAKARGAARQTAISEAFKRAEADREGASA